MTPIQTSNPAPLAPADPSADQPLELSDVFEPATAEGFDPARWTAAEAERRGAGGRTVLAGLLIALATVWLGFTAWSAGRTLAGEPLTSPMVAQWVAIAAGPLALLGLVWLMFGRTRRKEAERFTQAVVSMRSEARSLEALLEVLSQRLGDSQRALTGMVEQMMGLGDAATSKLDGLTREFDAGGARLLAHGEALDRAAATARVDIGVVLADLPQAEQHARQLAEQMRAIGSHSAEKTHLLAEQVGALGARARESDAQLDEASRRMGERLEQIELAGGSAASRVNEAERGLSGALDTLLDRTAATLDQIRSGVDAHSAAVTALVDQSAAAIGRAGADSAEALAGHVGRADQSLTSLSARVAEQEKASQRLIVDIDAGLAAIDQRFTELASNGDARAASFLDSLTRARSALDELAAQAGGQDNALAGLADRAAAVRGHLNHLADVTAALRPDLGWVRDAAADAAAKTSDAAATVAGQQQQLEALLATIDDGVGDAQAKLVALAASIGRTNADAAALSAETAPALVAALLQVKEAANHAADRAREAIGAVIPESADKLSARAREALEAAIQSSVTQQLQQIDGVATNAVEAARNASERLTQQIISIGQSAAALEAYVEEHRTEQREKDSEAFARRVALLIDSMNSAAIDVGKIMADEIDDKTWDSYLKGNRGVFTRRAVRLIGGSEARSIRTHYDSDREFQGAANRYIHDFEAMLRRVLAERDGGMIAVTLMSSDMGKLYAALAQVIGAR